MEPMITERENKFNLKYLKIQPEVFLNDKLDKNCCLLFELIYLLDGDQHCWASNGYFASVLGVTETTISTSLKVLIEQGYVEKLSFNGRIRHIKIKEDYMERYKYLMEDFNRRHFNYKKSCSNDSDLKNNLSQPLNDFKGCLKDPLTYNNITNNITNISVSKETETVNELTACINEEPSIKNSLKGGLKVLTEEQLLIFPGHTKEAKELLLFWNALPKPIKHHRLDTTTKLFHKVLDGLDHLLNLGNKPDRIKRSMQKYHKLLSLPTLRFNNKYLWMNVGLDHFIKPSTDIRERMVKVGLNIESWFDECCLDWRILEEKYSKAYPDKYPEITKSLEQTWPGKSNDFTANEKNILRKLSERVYNYFISVKDFKDDMTFKHKYPATCAKFVWRLLAEKNNFDFQSVPYWVLAGSLFEVDMPNFLKDINYIVPGWDGYCARMQEEQEERRNRRVLADQKDREDALSQADFL